MFEINGIPCLFSKVFDLATRVAPTVEKFVDEHDGKVAVFSIDLAATKQLLPIAQNVRMAGGKFYYFDHHLPEVVKYDKDIEYMAVLDQLIEHGCVGRVGMHRDVQPPSSAGVGLCGYVFTRQQAPGSATLVDKPWATSVALPAMVLADQDFDGLLGAMALCGVKYSGMEADAGILDGPRGGHGKLTPLAKLGAEALSALPVFDPQRPQVFQTAWEAWASDFVAASRGDTTAEGRLIAQADEYAKAVSLADGLPLEYRADKRLVYCALPPGGARIDLGTLARRMERAPAMATAVEKTMGPIVSAGHDRQISIAVVKQFQPQIDLRDAVVGLPTGPKEGVISNVPFLLHVSPAIWMSKVYPWLMKKLLDVSINDALRKQIVKDRVPR